MYRAEVRDGYVYVIDTNTGQERHFGGEFAGNAIAAQVTGDDEITITSRTFPDMPTRYQISSGHRAT